MDFNRNNTNSGDAVTTTQTTTSSAAAEVSGQRVTIIDHHNASPSSADDVIAASASSSSNTTTTLRSRRTDQSMMMAGNAGNTDNNNVNTNNKTKNKDEGSDKDGNAATNNTDAPQQPIAASNNSRRASIANPAVIRERSQSLALSSNADLDLMNAGTAASMMMSSVTGSSDDSDEEEGNYFGTRKQRRSVVSGGSGGGGAAITALSSQPSHSFAAGGSTHNLKKAGDRAFGSTYNIFNTENVSQTNTADAHKIYSSAAKKVTTKIDLEDRCRLFRRTTAKLFHLKHELHPQPRCAFSGDPDRIVDAVKNCLIVIRDSRIVAVARIRRLFQAVGCLKRWMKRWNRHRIARISKILDFWEEEEAVRRRALDLEMASQHYRTHHTIHDSINATAAVNVPPEIKMAASMLIVRRNDLAFAKRRTVWAKRIQEIESRLIEQKAILHASIFNRRISLTLEDPNDATVEVVSSLGGLTGYATLTTATTPTATAGETPTGTALLLSGGGAGPSSPEGYTSGGERNSPTAEGGSPMANDFNNANLSSSPLLPAAAVGGGAGRTTTDFSLPSSPSLSKSRGGKGGGSSQPRQGSASTPTTTPVTTTTTAAATTTTPSTTPPAAGGAVVGGVVRRTRFPPPAVTRERIKALRREYTEVALQCTVPTDATDVTFEQLVKVRDEIVQQRILVASKATINAYQASREERMQHRAVTYALAEKRRMEEYRKKRKALVKQQAEEEAKQSQLLQQQQQLSQGSRQGRARGRLSAPLSAGPLPNSGGTPQRNTSSSVVVGGGGGGGRSPSQHQQFFSAHHHSSPHPSSLSVEVLSHEHASQQFNGNSPQQQGFAAVDARDGGVAHHGESSSSSSFSRSHSNSHVNTPMSARGVGGVSPTTVVTALNININNTSSNNNSRTSSPPSQMALVPDGIGSATAGGGEAVSRNNTIASSHQHASLLFRGKNSPTGHPIMLMTVRNGPLPLRRATYQQQTTTTATVMNSGQSVEDQLAISLARPVMLPPPPNANCSMTDNAYYTTTGGGGGGGGLPSQQQRPMTSPSSLSYNASTTTPRVVGRGRIGGGGGVPTATSATSIALVPSSTQMLVGSGAEENNASFSTPMIYQNIYDSFEGGGGSYGAANAMISSRTSSLVAARRRNNNHPYNSILIPQQHGGGGGGGVGGPNSTASSPSLTMMAMHNVAATPPPSQQQDGNAWEGDDDSDQQQLRHRSSLARYGHIDSLALSLRQEQEQMKKRGKEEEKKGEDEGEEENAKGGKSSSISTSPTTSPSRNSDSSKTAKGTIRSLKPSLLKLPPTRASTTTSAAAAPDVQQTQNIDTNAAVKDASTAVVGSGAAAPPLTQQPPTQQQEAEEELDELSMIRVDNAGDGDGEDVGGNADDDGDDDQTKRHFSSKEDKLKSNIYIPSASRVRITLPPNYEMLKFAHTTNPNASLSHHHQGDGSSGSFFNSGSVGKSFFNHTTATNTNASSPATSVYYYHGSDVPPHLYRVSDLSQKLAPPSEATLLRAQQHAFSKTVKEKGVIGAMQRLSSSASPSHRRPVSTATSSPFAAAASSLPQAEAEEEMHAMRHTVDSIEDIQRLRQERMLREYNEDKYFYGVGNTSGGGGGSEGMHHSSAPPRRGREEAATSAGRTSPSRGGGEGEGPSLLTNTAASPLMGSPTSIASHNHPQRNQLLYTTTNASNNNASINTNNKALSSSPSSPLLLSAANAFSGNNPSNVSRYTHENLMGGGGGGGVGGARHSYTPPRPSTAGCVGGGANSIGGGGGAARRASSDFGGIPNSVARAPRLGLLAEQPGSEVARRMLDGGELKALRDGSIAPGSVGAILANTAGLSHTQKQLTARTLLLGPSSSASSSDAVNASASLSPRRGGVGGGDDRSGVRAASMPSSFASLSGNTNNTANNTLLLNSNVQSNAALAASTAAMRRQINERLHAPTPGAVTAAPVLLRAAAVSSLATQANGTNPVVYKKAAATVLTSSSWVLVSASSPSPARPTPNVASPSASTPNARSPSTAMVGNTLATTQTVASSPPSSFSPSSRLRSGSQQQQQGQQRKTFQASFLNKNKDKALKDASEFAFDRRPHVNTRK